MRLSMCARVVLLLLWLLPSSASYADYIRKMSFRNIMASQNFALGEVEAISQDSEGFIWLGGRNALLRYDGYDLLNVQLETGDESDDKLTSVTWVADVFEDADGELWVGTRSGVFLYNRDREVLVKPAPEDGNLTLFQTGSERIAQLPSGTLVFGSPNGLYFVDPKTRNARVISAGSESTAGLVNTVTHDVFVDKEGILWIGTDAGLTRYDEKSGVFQHFTPYPENPASLPDNGIWAIDRDHNDQLWLGSHRGIYRFDIASTSFVARYRHDPKDRQSLAGDLTRDIYVDSNGWVWTGSDAGAISLYDAQRQTFIHFAHDPNNPSSLSSNTIRRFFEDAAGDLWIGTYPSGVNFYDRSSAAITVYGAETNPELGLMSNETAAVVEDNEGNLWIGAGGVTKFDRSNQTFTHYSTANGKIASGAIISGHLDHDGDIWFGTWAGGYYRYNAQTDSFDKMPLDATMARSGTKQSNVLNDNVVWDIYQDSRGDLWLSTHNGGLSRYNKSTDQYTIYEQNLQVPDTIANQLVWTTFEDSQERFWVGTPSGLNLMDRDKGTFKKYVNDPNDSHSLANNSVLVVYEDNQNRLWMGTDAGLHLYREATDDFERFGLKDGFGDQGIRSIVQDDLGRLWMGTNNGVVVFNPDSKEVSNYKTYNGKKIGGFITGSAIKTQKGEIIIGGRNGLYLFDVSKLVLNDYVPPVVLTDFRIFTKSVPIGGEDSILSKVINQTDSITLDYKKTMFSFRFSALNFRESEKNQYAYKLEGFDEDWREVGDQRSALYTNLNAGNYTFKVRASNNDGIWNNEGASIHFKQLPPPWRTWWAHTIYALIAIGIVVQFLRTQRRKRRLVEEQNRILESRVAERTSELRAKNKDIQAMLSNMSQGLFTIESSGEVHPEYSKYLESIFERDSIAGANALELLLGSAHLGSNAINQASEAIKSVIGEDEMNFTFNEHLLPLEYEADFPSGTKYLALDWNPISEDEIVVKLMVSVRDVTQLKQMESEAQAKKRELDIISQLLNIPSKKYLNFAATAKDFIAENREQIRSHQSYNQAVVELLFRNMHTIKGNCRTFKFNYFSDVVHDVESAYSALKLQSEPNWQADSLLNDLERVEKVLSEYENVYYAVLGRGSAESSGRDNNGFWADREIIAKIKDCIERVNNKYPELEVAAEFSPVTDIIDAAIANPLDKVLSDIIKSLPSIAEQLGKEPPAVVFGGDSGNINSADETLLSNVYAHVLRNCVDHGIEPASERVAAGKPAKGTIKITSERKGGRLCMTVADDGRGLNIQRLFTKGVEAGKWTEHAPPSYQDIAQMIFDSGVSTKDEVTDISGRGVGMNAVKEFINKRGGDIFLAVTNPPKAFTADIFLPFSICIELPEAVAREI